MDNLKEEKIAYEILNDAFWLNFILEIKRNLTDLNQKEELALFVVLFSSIFCDETIKANLGAISETTNISEKDIFDFRNSNLKDCFNNSSKTATHIIREMGIDLENYVFDIVLTLNQSNIIDINFRNWNYLKPEKEDLLNGIVSTPNAWLNHFIPDIYNALITQIKTLAKGYANKISQLNILKKSYSSKKLFNKSSLSTDDKLYILQRYGLISMINFLDCLFNENIYITIGDNDLIFDSKLFFAKCKAIVLEMLWNDKKQNKSITIINEVFLKNDKLIPKKFFEINRRLRNNLHYGDYHFITSDELELVMEYQRVYIKNIIEVFDNYINIKFGFNYKFALTLAKIQRWANN